MADSSLPTAQERARVHLGDAAAPTMSGSWESELMNSDVWAVASLDHICTNVLRLAPNSPIRQYMEQESIHDVHVCLFPWEVNDFKEGLVYIDRSKSFPRHRLVPFWEANEVKIFTAFNATNNFFNGNEAIDFLAVTKHMYQTFRNRIYKPSVDYEHVISISQEVVKYQE